ncbi:MAG: hypothetical protein NC084_13405 [Bacteroides sp.]|nr:hypothetical protein [Eubacterium sp.]MCM1419709.1 hypothetical protein [Roseburia sp.]MCM1463693.1 hypothetical protein [Bacteroides sp.]
MEIKNKIKQVVLRIVCGLLLILALFLGAVSAVYAIGGGTPNLFGTSVFIVQTDAFDLLENGTALIAKQVQYAEIQPGNIVIFSLENARPALAEIRSGELSDGVYTFTAATENEDIITLSQSQIVAKGVSYSNFWGAVITFASSPVGLLLIAVLPCLVLIIIEFSKFLRKALPEPEIEPVKKQLEIPTYTPEIGKAAAAAAYRQTAKAADSLDDSIGLYDAQIRRNPSIERTDVLEIPAQPESPLFLGPKRKPIEIQQRRAEEPMPLSQKKLYEAIAAAKAAREREEDLLRRAENARDLQKSRAEAASEKEREAAAPAPSPKKETSQRPTEVIEPAAEPEPYRSAGTSPRDEEVKQYTPRSKPPQSAHATTSIPRLDALFSDDSDEVSYNIDDILAGLEHK